MTEPHRITRALLAAIMHSTEPMVLTDPNLPDHPMIAVNPAFTALTGYAQGQTVGRNCRFLQGAGTDMATTARIRRCLAERRGCIEWVVNYRHDGTRFWNLLFISPVFDRDGTLLHFFGNQRDITDGPPGGLPDYTLGKADMPAHDVAEFHELLLDVLEQDIGADNDASARTLERLVAAARQLNEVTTRLAPPPWTPFAEG
jgi:PAS domain S-box-containing protein